MRMVVKRTRIIMIICRSLSGDAATMLAGAMGVIASIALGAAIITDSPLGIDLPFIIAAILAIFIVGLATFAIGRWWPGEALS